MKWHLGVMGLCAWTLEACSTDPVVEEGQRAAEAMAVASEVVGLARAFAAPTEGLSGDAAAAMRAAAVAQAAFTPTGCTRIQLRDNAVRVIFIGECDGPYGIRVLGGALVATVTLRGVQTGVGLSGELRTRHSTLRPALGVTLSALGGSFQAEYVGTVAGVGARGTAVTFEGRGGATLDADCVQLTGSAAVTAGSEPWNVLIASYGRCADGCPMRDGSLLLSRAAGAPTRVDLSGGENVSVTTASGRPEAATVPCGR